MSDNSEREFTPLTDNRLHHMNAVANRAYTLAKIMFGKTEYLARKMYIYGLLHDVGYVFDPSDHAHAGARVLGDMGLDADPINDHGDPMIEAMSDELLILNVADMTTSPTGETVRMSDRLKDIGERYGYDSKQYVDAYKVAELIHDELTARGIPAVLL